MATSNLPDPRSVNFYGANEEDLSEYQKSLDDSIKALQQRYEQPNWFNVAAGFFKPQLGGFAASLGSASQAMGENLEKQRESQLPIAQMRSQLAMSKIAMGQNKTAADMEAARLLKGEALSPQYVSKLVNLAPGSAQAKAAQAELAAMQESQRLASSEAATRSTQYGNALTKVRELNAAGGFANPKDYADALAAVEAAYGPLTPNKLREPTETVGGVGKKVTGAGGAGAVSTDAAAAAAAAAAAKAPDAAAAAAAATSTPKIVGSGDFIKRGVRASESVNGEPNPSSTAVGPGQIIEGTRKSLQKKYNIPGSINDYATDSKKADVYDYANLADNHAALAAAGKEPTALNHRLMWWFGTGDGPKILNAKDNAPLNSLGLTLKENKEEPKKDQYLNNGLKADMTVGQLKSQISTQLQKNKIDPNAAVVFNGMDATPVSTSATSAAPAAAPADTAAAAAAARAKIESMPITVSNKLESYPPTFNAVQKAGIDQRNEVKKANAVKAEAVPYDNYVQSQLLLAPGLQANAKDTFSKLDDFTLKHQPEIAQMSNLLREKGGFAGALAQKGVGVSIMGYGANFNVDVLSALKNSLPKNLWSTFDDYTALLGKGVYYGLLGNGIDPNKMTEKDLTNAVKGYLTSNIDIDKTPVAQYAGIKNAQLNFEHRANVAEAWNKQYQRAIDAGSLSPAADSQKHPAILAEEEVHKARLEKERQRIAKLYGGGN